MAEVAATRGRTVLRRPATAADRTMDSMCVYVYLEREREKVCMCGCLRVEKAAELVNKAVDPFATIIQRGFLHCAFSINPPGTGRLPIVDQLVHCASL